MKRNYQLNEIPFGYEIGLLRTLHGSSRPGLDFQSSAVNQQCLQQPELLIKLNSHLNVQQLFEIAKIDN